MALATMMQSLLVVGSHYRFDHYRFEPCPVYGAQNHLKTSQHTEDACKMFTENEKKNQCAHTIEMLFHTNTISMRKVIESSSVQWF